MQIVQDMAHHFLLKDNNDYVKPQCYLKIYFEGKYMPAWSDKNKSKLKSLSKCPIRDKFILSTIRPLSTKVEKS